jgi:hypothetical protein
MEKIIENEVIREEMEVQYNGPNYRQTTFLVWWCVKEGEERLPKMNEIIHEEGVAWSTRIYEGNIHSWEPMGG